MVRGTAFVVLSLSAMLIAALGCNNDSHRQASAGPGEATAGEAPRVCVSLGAGSDKRAILAREAQRRGLGIGSRGKALIAEQLAKALLTELRRRVHVSDAAVDARLERLTSKGSAAAVRPTLVWLLQLVTTKRSSADAARSELVAIDLPARRRARFRELVRAKSVDGESKRRGGSLGFVSPSSLGPCVSSQAALDAPRGELFGPCERSKRFYLYLKVKNSRHPTKVGQQKRVALSRGQVKQQLVEEEVQRQVVELLRRARAARAH